MSESAGVDDTGAVRAAPMPGPPATSGQPAASLGGRYWQVLAATGTSAFGDGLVLVAFPLLAVTLTHSPLLVAGVAAAGQLPWLLVSLPAGALADRVDRRRLATAIEVLRGVALLLLTVLIAAGADTLAVLYAAAFFIGTCETAFFAATNAVLPDLIGRETLARGNGYLLSAETAGEQFAGPALGGVIFGWFAAAPFLLDSVSYGVSALLLWRALPRRSTVSRTGPGHLMADIRFGLVWFLRHRLLRVLALVISTLAFCQAVVLSVLVLYGLRVLHLDTAGYGLFLAAGALGNVVGGLIAGRVYSRFGPAAAVLGAGLVAASAYVLLSRTSLVAVAVVGMGMQAIAVAVGNVSTLSLRQAVIPPELLGRVNNAFRTCVFGVMPLGALVGGLLATHLGLSTTFLLAGLVQAGLLVLLARPLVTRLDAGVARTTSARV
jgi:MFS family permease